MKAIQQLVEKKSLTAEQCSAAFYEMAHEPIQMGAFLALLRAKGESVEEILGMVMALRSEMIPLHLDQPVLDIVGTGGDRAGTVNISTGAALLAARCGVPIVKHGNRSVSSQSGSADLLEAMGYPIHQTPEEVKKNLQQSNFAFCFAPDYHPAMKQIRSVRTSLKIPTIFNLIGPLLNPAGTEHLQIGVYQPAFVKTIAEVLFRLGTKRSLVYCGHGIDELSCIGPTEAILVTEKGMETLTIDPQKLGLNSCILEDLKGGSPQTNAEKLKNPSSKLRDTLLLNAATALFLYGTASSIQEGLQISKSKFFKKSLKEAIRRQPCALIAEIKRASPSKGVIGVIPDAAERARYYESQGAVALSVLTSERFAGSLADLKAVAEAVSIPVLRKDFITTPEQLAEVDADAVLLIVFYLGSVEKTKEMLARAQQLGMEAVVEVHNEAELQIALAAGAEIIGINQRNLSDFTMHPESYQLIRKMPQQIIKIAESGVCNISDAKERFQMGYDAILVGEALTLNPKLCEALCSLKSAD